MAGTASGTCAASPWDAVRVRDKRRVLWPTAAVAFVLSLPAGSSRGTARHGCRQEIPGSCCGSHRLSTFLTSLLALPGCEAS